MKTWRNHGGLGAGLFGSALLFSAQAASSMSNPLTGFTSDTSLPATQVTLAGAGLQIDLTTADPAASFDANGAHFGTFTAGDGGRNYLRTIESDYATVSFVAEITMTTTADGQDAFLGFGAGGVALFGTPDWSTQNSSASFWPDSANDKILRFRTQNDINAFSDTAVPGFEPGTHRFRMSFDEPAQTFVGAIDLNYAGGPFAADTTTLPIDVSSLFAPDGWPSEPSRVFFGGDDGVAFRDLSITVEGEVRTDVPEVATPAWLLALGALALVMRNRRKNAAQRRVGADTTPTV